MFCIGDAGDKWALFEREALAALNVKVNEHGKMPDLVIYIPDRNWLVALGSSKLPRPVDSKRQAELADLFAESTAGLVYVSCFLTGRSFASTSTRSRGSRSLVRRPPDPHDPLQRRTLLMGLTPEHRTRKQ